MWEGQILVLWEYAKYKRAAQTWKDTFSSSITSSSETNKRSKMELNPQSMQGSLSPLGKYLLDITVFMFTIKLILVNWTCFTWSVFSGWRFCTEVKVTGQCGAVQRRDRCLDPPWFSRGKTEWMTHPPVPSPSFIIIMQTQHYEAMNELLKRARRGKMF